MNDIHHSGSPLPARQRTRWLATLIVTALALAGAACDGDDTTGPNGDPPAQPSNLSVQLDGTTVSVTWTPPGTATTQTVSLSGEGEDDRTQEVGGSDSEAVFESLTPNKEYTASVVARNEHGNSPAASTQFQIGGVAFNNLLADPAFPGSAFDIGTRTDPPEIISGSMPSGYVPFDVATLNGGAGIVMPTDGRQLVSTDYAGAVEPGTSLQDAWYYGWTVWAPDGSDSRAKVGADTVITGTIESDQTWTQDRTWILDGPVFIGSDCGADGSAPGCNDVTLTIEPGTTIMGRPTPSNPGQRGSFLVVSRGSQLIADAQNPDFGGSGQCERPDESDVIVFTSENAPGSRGRGDWGGVVVNGRAPINSGDEAQGEGNSGLYGGSDPTDSSGILRGVRVEFAGDDVTATDQLNGIAWQGSGAGTTACFLQVHYNVDDGTEPFGGATTQTHSVMTGVGDDSFDGTDGWQGFMQFAIAQQRADDADNGFEFSNNGDDEDASPHTTAVVANVTLIGAGVSLGSGEIAGLGGGSDVGVLLREGANVRIFNTVVVGFGDTGFDVEGSIAARNADNRMAGSLDVNSTLRFESSILWSNAGQGAGSHNFSDASGDGYTASENEAFFKSGG